MTHHPRNLLLLNLLLLSLLLSPSPAFGAAVLDLQQQGLRNLTIAWSGAPPDAQVVYGKAVVGGGPAGSVTIDPAQIVPGRTAVLYWQGQTLAQATTEGLLVSWEGTQLHVIWGAPEPGCLVLSGGPPDQLLDLPCAAAGDVRLPSGGVDQAYAPQRYQRVELRRQADLGRVLDRAPTWRLVLPIVVSGNLSGKR